MKLSIIIPVYNSEKHLKRLMNSILKSKEDFEVICVDDGSTDGSLKILKSIEDKRVLVYSKKNEGVYKTWKFGFQVSKGEYVTVFDSDDYIDTEYISFIYSTLKKQIDVLCTPYYIEKDSKSKVCDLPLEEGIYEGEKLEKVRRILISGAFPCAKHTKVIRREFVNEQIGHAIQESINDFEDWMTMIPIFNNVNSVYISHDAFYHYVQHNNSVSKSTVSYQENYRSLQSVINFLKSDGYAKLPVEDIEAINFYGSRSVLYRAIKIREFELAQKILKSELFHAYIFKSRLRFFEKTMLFLMNSEFIYMMYMFKSKLGKV